MYGSYRNYRDEDEEEYRPFFMIVREYGNELVAITQAKDEKAAKNRIGLYYSEAPSSLRAFKLSEYEDWKEKRF